MMTAADRYMYLWLAQVALTGLLVMCFVGFTGCTDDDASREALHKAGFTDVETTGYEVFACSEDDAFHTGFRAKNPQGQIVTGTVCCGWMKSCTIRW